MRAQYISVGWNNLSIISLQGRVTTFENNEEGKVRVKKSRGDDAYVRYSIHLHTNQRSALIFEFWVRHRNSEHMYFYFLPKKKMNETEGYWIRVSLRASYNWRGQFILAAKERSQRSPGLPAKFDRSVHTLSQFLICQYANWFVVNVLTVLTI